MAITTLLGKLKDRVICSQISRKRDGSGNYIFRKSYFYTNGATEEGFAEYVTTKLTQEGIEHTVVDCGNHWTEFKGGASIAKQSHFWVEVAATNDPYKK